MLNESDIKFYGKENIKIVKDLLKKINGKSYDDIRKIIILIKKLAGEQSVLTTDRKC